MNIEIANRLVNLRKSNNLSQEALAEKLGISRQAVSKWERAEASPDTDNLILLARLYKVSLDELLKTEDEIPMPEPEEVRQETGVSIAEAGKEAGVDAGGTDAEMADAGNGMYVEEPHRETDGGSSKDGEEEYVHIGFGGVHVKDKDGEVHVGWDGIHVDDYTDGDNVHIDKNGVYVNGEKYSGREFFLHRFPMTATIVIAYFVIGCVFGAWHPGWLLFLLIPIWHSLVSAIENRSAYHFAYPVLATLIYLCLGFFWFLWHPGWIIYLTVPLYYSAASWINSVIRGGRERDGGLSGEE